ncbi:hypothetical protein MRB53_040231 [Persea americana]|nr:hypothetical protein MRB53_040231 [Persea americana]
MSADAPGRVSDSFEAGCAAVDEIRSVTMQLVMTDGGLRIEQRGLVPGLRHGQQNDLHRKMTLNKQYDIDHKQRPARAMSPRRCGQRAARQRQQTAKRKRHFTQSCSCPHYLTQAFLCCAERSKRREAKKKMLVAYAQAARVSLSGRIAGGADDMALNGRMFRKQSLRWIAAGSNRRAAPVDWMERTRASGIAVFAK